MSEDWIPVLLNIFIIAIVVVAFVIWMLYSRSQYEKQCRGAIWVDIWLPSGDSFKKLVKPTVDGWIHILKGDYKLSVSQQFCKCGHEVSHHVMDDNGKLKCEDAGCPCKEYELARVIPNIRRKDKYPPRPFLGMRCLQCDVRTESWFLNNPDAITWADSRATVTALDAYVHSREMVAEQNAASIAETDARLRKWEQVLTKLPDKMILYVLLGGVAIGLIVLIIRSVILEAG